MILTIVILTLIILLPILSMRLFHKFRSNRRHHHHHRPHLSVIIPFREGDDLTRDRVFQDTLRYYTTGLPEAEIIVAVDPLNAYPFNKSAAINHGVRKSRGKILAIVDADCYIDCDTIRQVAREIEEAVDEGRRLWYIPYERFYRLNKTTTLEILPDLQSNATLASLGDPPSDDKLDPSPANHSTGHYYGALIQIMPREAFDCVGGWDVLFSGWGSEDVSMLLSLDTLYGSHKVFDGPVYHLWHHINFGSYQFTRTWIGQDAPERNWRLAAAYKNAAGNYDAMYNLCEDSLLVELARNEHLDAILETSET
jgi:glycosyltransferase involved in cell wall biosynthesis